MCVLPRVAPAPHTTTPPHDSTPQRRTSPAAIMRDRHSRDGQVKGQHDRKMGAGAHNWGSLDQEENNVYQGTLDAEQEGMFDADDSSVSESPVDSVNELEQRPAQPARRMSAVSDEDRERATRYREGYKKAGTQPTLIEIARSAVGVQDPNAEDKEMLSTSPLRSKAGFSVSSHVSQRVANVSSSASIPTTSAEVAISLMHHPQPQQQ